MMRNFVLALFGLISLHYSNGELLELKDSNFKEIAAKHSLLLVKFYAPWCGHCKRLAPDFEAAAKELETNDPPISLAKVDCTVETQICGEVGVTGYPTLKVYKHGNVASEYDGARTKDGIVSYLKARAGPSSKLFENEEQFKKIRIETMPIIVGYFKSEQTDLAKTFMKLADLHMSSFKFGHTYKNVLPKSDKEFIRIYQNIAMVNKIEDEYVQYNGEVALLTISDWLTKHAYGLCGLRTSENDKFFNKPLITVYYDLDYTRDPKGSAYWRNRVLKVAKQHKADGSKTNFAVANRNEFSYELSNYGVEPPFASTPTVAAMSSNKKKYIMTNEFSWDNLKKFAKEFDADKLVPFLKSEPVPIHNTEAVKTVVGSTFDNIVNDPTKDVLIEFYAEWCGHCKQLKPIYENLAESLKNEPNLVIAAMEATKNDVPELYSVQGFPTIYFVKKGSKNAPQKYDGGRELEAFIKYLSAESTDELSKYDRSGKEKKTEL